MQERTERHLVGISLPYDIRMPHRQVNRPVLVDRSGQLMQNAVPHVDGIIQAVNRHRRTILVGEIFKDALSAETGLRILSDRLRRYRFVDSAAAHRRERVHIS